MPARSVMAPLLLAGLLCTHVAGQTSCSARIHSLFTKSPTDRLVDQLVENASIFRTTLPSITAHETIESGASEGWVWKSHAKAEAIMRVMRKTPDGPLEESRQVTTVNGKPLPPGKQAKLPTLLLGGFGGFESAFFTSTRRHCFSYTLIPNENPSAPLELHIALSPQAPSDSCPPGMQRLSATALITSDTHHLTHLEWNIPEQDAGLFSRWPVASTDFAPIQIGDQTFWLPTTVAGHADRGKEHGTWTSHYSDYHRFTATTRIVPSAP